MADTTFVDNETLVPAAWLNDVNDATYNIVDIRQYGAVCDGTTDDTAAWLLARTALQTKGGGILTGPGGKTTVVSAQIEFTSDKCFVYAPGLTIKVTGSTNISGVLVWNGGGVQATPVLGTNASRGAKTISVSTLGGLAADSWLRMAKTTADGGATYTFVTKVRSVSGSGPWTITLETALPLAFNTADAGMELKRLDMLDGGGVIGPISFDGTASTATTLHAIALNNTVNCRISGISGIGFDAGAVVYTTAGHNNLFDDIAMEASGNASYSDIQLFYQTGANISNVRSLNAAGFGPQLSGCSYCTVNGVVSEGAQAGRGIKFAACVGCNIDDASAHGAAYTGIGISNGSQYNNFTNLSANGNALSEGVWLSDQTNTNNNFVNLQGTGNLNYDLYVGASDTSNNFTNLQVSTYYFANSLCYISGANHGVPQTGNSIVPSSVDSLAIHGSTVTIGATTSETTLATIVVPANRMGPNGRVTVKAFFETNSSANNKTFRIKFGGTTVWSTVQTTVTSVAVESTTCNRNNVASQTTAAMAYSSAAFILPSITTSTVATTSDVTILITGEKANSGDTLLLFHYSVEIVKQ